MTRKSCEKVARRLLGDQVSVEAVPFGARFEKCVAKEGDRILYKARNWDELMMAIRGQTPRRR